MTDSETRRLKVALALVWAGDDIYHATVSVTVTDSGYALGNLYVGIPVGKVGLAEAEYLAFDFTHKEGVSGDLVKTIEKTIDLKFSPARPNVTAFAVVNGSVSDRIRSRFRRDNSCSRRFPIVPKSSVTS